MLLFVGTVSLVASGDVNIYPIVGSKKAKVSLAAPAIGRTYLTLENQEGDTYYSERVNGPANYAKVYDFSTLESGTYKLVVRSNNKTIEKGN
ncbi:MAG: hypothetical protein HC896_06100 [Bacteroidales bacterium]|nr:hypothetical protein [Bacteroidales bacterium]